MARQPRTRQPKEKFSNKCLHCKALIIVRIENGKLVRRCACGTPTDHR